MSLWKIVRRSLAQRKLSSALTAASIALGVAVVVGVLSLKAQGREGFNQTAFGYDLVVGPRGSALQLVLNTVFHMDVSPGNVPEALHRELAAHPGVKLAVPIAVGDQHRGFRIVGTTPRFLAEFEATPGRRFEIEGRAFRGGFEAVVGAKTGLRPGETFEAAHGVIDSVEKHDERWTVVGRLKPTGTPCDRAIYVGLDGFHAVRGHESHSEISAVIVQTRAPNAREALRYDLNRRTDCMAVVPAEAVAKLFDLIGAYDVALLAVSLLVIAVAGVSILVSIYNTMSERRRAIAIMRALGARRSTILSIVLLEAVALAFLGGGAGIVLGHVLSAAAGSWVSSGTGVSISAVTFLPEEFAVFAGVVLLGALAGLLPALKAYRADVVEGLSPAS